MAGSWRCEAAAHATTSRPTRTESLPTNRFTVLAMSDNWHDDGDDDSSKGSILTDHCCAHVAELGFCSKPPPRVTVDATLCPSKQSKRLPRDELVPGRVIYVQNPSGEKSWRGHPGLVLETRGRTARVITLTSWNGRTCAQKWASSVEPARYRKWFVLVNDGCTPAHDDLPVMMLCDGKTMPKVCYVDCKRTHLLDVSELEKFRSPDGDTEFFVTEESIRALKRHLAYLNTIKTPWVGEVVVINSKLSAEMVARIKLR